MNNDNNSSGSRIYLFSIVTVAVLGGLLFGYDTAVISGAEKGLQAFFLGAKDFIYTDTIHGITSSSALLGCILGSAISGFIASRFGRKPSLILAGILFLVSALGSYYPEFFFFDYGKPSLSLLIAFNIYRIVGGVGVGLASVQHEHGRHGRQVRPLLRLRHVRSDLYPRRGFRLQARP